MIILIGMMGSGKSSIGKELARNLGYTFIDTDNMIEHKEAIKIHDLINRKGLDYFRDLEVEVLKQSLSTYSGQTVIATGGGIILRPENRNLLQQSGKTIIYLQNSVASLVSHLRNTDVSKRPLLKGDLTKTLSRLLNEREELYKEVSTITLNCNNLDKASVLKSILYLHPSFEL